MNIIITGASAGIGFALAKLYAKQGVNLGLIGRSSEKLAIISAICREQGAQVVTAAIDVTDTEALKNWLLAFDAPFPVDLLIANAGVTSIMPDDGAGESWAAVSHSPDPRGVRGGRPRRGPPCESAGRGRGLRGGPARG